MCIRDRCSTCLRSLAAAVAVLSRALGSSSSWCSPCRPASRVRSRRPDAARSRPAGPAARGGPPSPFTPQ
eukprot:7344130-Alexandrium_andersonii.AAC.1